MYRPRLLLPTLAMIGAFCLAVVSAGVVRSALAERQPVPRIALPVPAAPNVALSIFTQIAAGGAHTCAVTNTGGVQCWGLNSSGQLGSDDTDNRTKPTVVVGLTGGVTSVTSGGVHTCALLTTGSVQCWGNNGKGQLGVGTADFIQSTPLHVTGLTGGVRMVAAGAHHTCALTTSGGVQCWGFNGDGQLGDGSYSPSNTPVGVVGLSSGVSAIAVGGLHTCALFNGGSVQCWGDIAGAQSTTPVAIAGLTSGVSALVAGGAHACALLTTGGVQCWGGNNAGQLGDGSTTERATPVDVLGLSSGVTALAAGDSHTCALLGNGGVKCWGDNFAGQLGDGAARFRTMPVDVVGLSSGVRAITAGAGHTCALLESNAAKCWGDNFAGQLGDGAVLLRSTPLLLPEVSDGAQAVAAGFLHSCLVIAGGSNAGGVECWGDNNQSQRGGNSHSGGTAHTPIFSLRNGVTALAAGFYHTCALTNSGAVQCWGGNPVGQLGNGTNLTAGSPITVTGLSSGINAIVTGGDHTCALTSGGGVKCWGRNAFGQLGNNSPGHRTTPVDVAGLTSGVSALAAGWFHTCALTTGGGVQCWGRNNRGQLGDGANLDRPTPTDVTGLSSGVSAIAAAGEHTCALTSSGVKCWGLNSNGQLGDGSLTVRNTPVDVIGLASGITALSVGSAHSCARTSAGALKCWGWNHDGQLGDGTTLNRTTPVNVSGLGANVSAVSAGQRHTCALTDNNQVFCWGANHAGQVGDITARQLTPVDVLVDVASAFTCTSVSEIPAPECAALVALYEGTNGANWITRTNWLATTTPCGWYGVICAQGSVTELNLQNNALNGSIPPQLGKLANLQTLYLMENQLIGSVPDELGNLANMTHLYVHDNPLSGPLPVALTALTKLAFLRFAHTNICEPQELTFQTWLAGIANVLSSEIPCTTTGDRYESNNICTQATTIPSDGTQQQHTFHVSGDTDWVTFTATAGAHYLVRADVPVTSTADVNLAIHAACDGGALDQQGHPFTPGVELEFVAPSSGPLFLKLTDADSNRAGANVYYELAVRQLSAPPTTSALIIVAGGIGGNDLVKSNIYYVTDRVRNVFLENGYLENQIRYLAADPNHTHVTAAATSANLEQAITEWAVSKVAGNGALTLYLMDHGGTEIFYLDKAQGEWVTPDQLDGWLAAVETAHPGVKINVIIEACYAGSFISGPQTISKAGRVVITSTRDNFVAWASPQGAIFSDYFLAALTRKASLDVSFQRGWAAALAYHTTQTAWLDADGNGVPNEPADRAMAAQRGFGIAGTLPPDEWPPYIVAVQPPATTQDGNGLIQAAVRDDVAVEDVWAVIYPPSYAPPTSGEALVRDEDDAAISTIKLLDANSDGIYASNYTGFTQPGRYRIVVYAEDQSNLTAQPLAVEVLVAGSNIFLPLVAR